MMNHRMLGFQTLQYYCYIARSHVCHVHDHYGCEYSEYNILWAVKFNYSTICAVHIRHLNHRMNTTSAYIVRYYLRRLSMGIIIVN